jgi:hypothetical protein
LKVLPTSRVRREGGRLSIRKSKQLCKPEKERYNREGERWLTCLLNKVPNVRERREGGRLSTGRLNLPTNVK